MVNVGYTQSELVGRLDLTVGIFGSFQRETFIYDRFEDFEVLYTSGFTNDPYTFDFLLYTHQRFFDLGLMTGASYPVFSLGDKSVMLEWNSYWARQHAHTHTLGLSIGL